MGLTIREVKAEQATYNDALDFTSVFHVAFRNDPGFWMYQRPMYRFNGTVYDSILSVSNSKKRLDMLVSRSKAFRDHVLQDSWGFYKYMIQPGRQTFIAYDDSACALPVAIAQYVTPACNVEPLTWTARILLFLKSLRANIHMWAFKLIHGFNPAMVPQADRLFVEARNITGFMNTPERESYLVSANDETLLKVPYTDKYAYELSIFGCARPGQGIGKWFFDVTLKDMESRLRNVTIGGSEKRPKVAILASAQGRLLYSKFGFQAFDTYEKKAPDDDKQKFTITLMSKNY